MSFAKHLAGEAFLFLLAVLTMPLWLPFWLYLYLRDWYRETRQDWERIEATRKRDEGESS